jgi:hypothetical protein
MRGCKAPDSPEETRYFPFLFDARRDTHYESARSKRSNEGIDR